MIHRVADNPALLLLLIPAPAETGVGGREEEIKGKLYDKISRKISVLTGLALASDTRLKVGLISWAETRGRFLQGLLLLGTP